MAFFGWLCMMTALGWVSLIYLVAFLNGMGKYNIGGVPNLISVKICIVLVGLFLVWVWSLLISIAPFTVTMS